MSSPDSPITVASDRKSGRQLHRQSTLRTIIFPFLLAVSVIIAIFAVSALLSDPLARSRVSIIADFMMTTMILCPMVIVLFVVYMLIVVLNYGMVRLHAATGTPLQRLENLTQRMSERAGAVTGKVNEQAVKYRSWFAKVEHFMSAFEDLSENHTENKPEEKTDGTAK